MTLAARRNPIAPTPLMALAALLLTACATPAPPAPAPGPATEPETAAEAPPAAAEAPADEAPEPLVVVAEAWETVRRPEEDLGAVAVWPGAGDRAWVLATAEATDRLLLYDAGSGEFLRDFGSAGDGDGRFRRPAGLWIVDDLAFVTERGNGRVQVLRLPGLSTVGHLDGLRNPTGIRGAAAGGGAYEVWITDPVEGTERAAPERAYRVRVGEDGLEAAPMAVVGGVPDSPPAEDGLAGPRAAALYRCAWDAGYWIAAEAEPADGRTVFRVLDRVTREPVGRFRGERTAGTDGVWLSTVPIPDFPAGALYAVHDDASVTAFDWRHVAEALGLRDDCASDGK